MLPDVERVWDYENGLHPVFQMNLPEGSLRAKLDAHFAKAVAGYDEMKLLGILGSSQIGRLRFSQFDQSLPPVEDVPFQSIREILSFQGSEDLFRALVEKFGRYSGISGMQPKVLIRGEEPERIGDRYTHRGATHIVKAWESDFPFLAANELCCLSAARRAGLAVPCTEMSEDGHFLVVTRFDLTPGGVYLGFEDMCSLCGLPPAAKYERSYEDVAEKFSVYLSGDSLAAGMDAYFRMVVLSIALRNGDAHLKNFGVVFDTLDDIRIAPAFDVITTTVYEPRDTMALSLNGTKAWPGRETVRQFGVESCGLVSEAADHIIDEVAAAVRDTIPELEEYAGTPALSEKGARLLQTAWETGIAGLSNEFDEPELTA